MKTEAFSSPFWFAIHEGYPPRPLFVKALRGLILLAKGCEICIIMQADDQINSQDMD